MPETLVTIGKYLDDTEAHVAAGLLQSEGIPVFPPGFDRMSANPLPGIGSVRLRVPASFEREARRLLANHDLSDEAGLANLATGDASKPENAESDRFVFGMFSISDRVKRKKFWIYLVSFDVIVFSLILLAIWSA